MTALKSYLGDGCFADHDGYQLVLTTSNGIEDTNTIALEPEVWRALVRYVAELEAKGVKA
jgi:hypothetical protein